MTPEEAKSRDLDDLFEEGWKFKVGRIDGAGWFTAKETAEIALSYAYAERRHISVMNEASAMGYDTWREKFKEWSK